LHPGPCYSAVEYQFQTYSPLLLNVTVRKTREPGNSKRKMYWLRRKVDKIAFPKATRPAKRETAAAAVATSGRKKGSNL